MGESASDAVVDKLSSDETVVTVAAAAAAEAVRPLDLLMTRAIALDTLKPVMIDDVSSEPCLRCSSSRYSDVVQTLEAG